MEERTNADGDTTPHIVMNISTPVHNVNNDVTSGRQMPTEQPEMDIDSTLSTELLIPADLCVYPITVCAVTSAGHFIPVPINLFLQLRVIRLELAQRPPLITTSIL